MGSSRKQHEIERSVRRVAVQAQRHAWHDPAPDADLSVDPDALRPVHAAYERAQAAVAEAQRNLREAREALQIATRQVRAYRSLMHGRQPDDEPAGWPDET